MEYILDQIFLFSLEIILLIFLVKSRSDDFMLRPKVILPLVIYLFIVLGNINLEFFQDVVGWYMEIQPRKGNFWALIALIIFSALLLNFKHKRNKNFKNQKFNKYLVSGFISEKNLNNFIFIFSIVSIIINTYNYSTIGGVILFKENLTGYERFILQDKLPIEKGLTLSSFLIFPILLNLFFFNRRRMLFIVLLMVNIIFSFGLGHRQNLLMPFLIFSLFLYSYNLIRNRYLIIAVILFPILIFATSLFRGDQGNVELESTTSFFGNEYRDYLRLQDERIVFQQGRTILSVVYNSVPQQFFLLLGIEKKDYSVYSAYILKDLWGNETGQRAGIWGEFFLNWGYWGVLICFIFYSYIVNLVDKKYVDLNIRINQKIIFSYLYSLLLFSIIASWASIGDDIGGQGLLIYLFSNIIIKN